MQHISIYKQIITHSFEVLSFRANAWFRSTKLWYLCTYVNLVHMFYLMIIHIIKQLYTNRYSSTCPIWSYVWYLLFTKHRLFVSVLHITFSLSLSKLFAYNIVIVLSFTFTTFPPLSIGGMWRFLGSDWRASYLNSFHSSLPSTVGMSLQNTTCSVFEHQRASHGSTHVTSKTFRPNTITQKVFCRGPHKNHVMGAPGQLPLCPALNPVLIPQHCLHMITASKLVMRNNILSMPKHSSKCISSVSSAIMFLILADFYCCAISTCWCAVSTCWRTFLILKSDLPPSTGTICHHITWLTGWYN